MVICMSEKDLSSFDIRVDLINEINIKETKEISNYENIKVERITLNEGLAKKIKKRKGNYISIIFNDATDIENRKNIERILTNELKSLLDKNGLINKSCLTVGLGNKLSTPDSLGPKTVDNVITTRHLFVLDNLDENYNVVSKIIPGVFATTGIETYDIIKGIVDRTKPDFLIVIDSLKSSNIKNINKVIQITDSGIDPGSGVGNQRKEISQKTLERKVIVIGIPTVVNLHTIVKDFLDEYDIDEILKQKKNNFLVTPKDIDFEIEKLSLILANAINNSLHKLTK